MNKLQKYKEIAIVCGGLIAWGRIENGSEECARNEFGEPYYQIFRMSNNGTLRIIKFEDYWVERTPQGVRSRADKVEGGYL